MNLHRSDTRPEWQAVSQYQRNVWQRVAASTAGIVTPGNILTLIGFSLALAGLGAILDERYWLGTIGLIVGRLLDIADGWAAEQTGTKSPLGESLDASIDKLITGGTIVVLGIAGLVSWWVLLGLLTPHLLITIVATIAISRGKRFHPSRTGKLSMALVWGGLVGFVVATAADSTILLNVSYAAGITSIGLGLFALTGYINDSQHL